MLGTRRTRSNKVNGILAHNGTNIEYLLDEAQNKKAEELAQAYVRGEEDAIALVHKHLENAGVTIDDLAVKSYARAWDRIY